MTFFPRLLRKPGRDHQGRLLFTSGRHFFFWTKGAIETLRLRANFCVGVNISCGAEVDWAEQLEGIWLGGMEYLDKVSRE